MAYRRSYGTRRGSNRGYSGGYRRRPRQSYNYRPRRSTYRRSTYRRKTYRRKTYKRSMPKRNAFVAFKCEHCYDGYSINIPYKEFKKISYWAGLLVAHEVAHGSHHSKHRHHHHKSKEVNAGDKLDKKQWRLKHHEYIEELLKAKAYEKWVLDQNAGLIKELQVHHQKHKSGIHLSHGEKTFNKEMKHGLSKLNLGALAEDMI